MKNHGVVCSTSGNKYNKNRATPKVEPCGTPEIKEVDNKCIFHDL